MAAIGFSEPTDAMPPPSVHPKRDLSNMLWIEAQEKFPNFDIEKTPRKPSKVPYLYSLVEQTCDVIDFILLHCKE